MAIKIHPKIWDHVRKMYDYYYGDKYKDVLISLFGIDETTIDKTAIDKSIFDKLDFNNALIVIKDLLENNNVKNDINNNWNIYGDYIKYWRPELLDYIRENGIIYNEDVKNFSLADGEAIPLFVPNRQLAKLVDLDFGDVFYNNLRDEINEAFRMRLFTSVMLLSRKLFENLLIEILRIKYPPNINGNLEIYYKITEQRFQNFTILLKNIEDKKSDFTVDEHLITEIISKIKPFRKSANSNAHSIIIVSNQKEILSFDIPLISALLLKLDSNMKKS